MLTIVNYFLLPVPFSHYSFYLATTNDTIPAITSKIIAIGINPVNKSPINKSGANTMHAMIDTIPQAALNAKIANFPNTAITKIIKNKVNI